MNPPLEVLPDLQPGGCWVQQVCDDLLVDLQEAASAYEPHLPPFPLPHAAPPVSNASQSINAGFQHNLKQPLHLIQVLPHGQLCATYL